MKITSIRFIVLVVILGGCASKNDSDPSTPVLNFYKAVNEGDTTAILNTLTTDIREKFKNPQDSTFKMYHQIQGWKGTKAEVKIREVHVDSAFPNMAVVHFSVKFTGKNPTSFDSVNLHVAKENEDWKISSLDMHRDNE